MKKWTYKNIAILITTFFSSVFLVQSVWAVCPVCSIAAGAGLSLSHWLGIDDTITGLWIGGLIISLIIWTDNWLDNRNIKFYGRDSLVFLGYYLLTIAPLGPARLIGNPFNMIWGIDKLVLGVIIGSITFWLGNLSYIYLKKRHNDRAYFPFQKVVMPIAPLIILSIVFWLTIG